MVENILKHITQTRTFCKIIEGHCLECLDNIPRNYNANHDYLEWQCDNILGEVDVKLMSDNHD